MLSNTLRIGDQSLEKNVKQKAPFISLYLVPKENLRTPPLASDLEKSSNALAESEKLFDTSINRQKEPKGLENPLLAQYLVARFTNPMYT